MQSPRCTGITADHVPPDGRLGYFLGTGPLRRHDQVLNPDLTPRFTRSAHSFRPHCGCWLSSPFVGNAGVADPYLFRNFFADLLVYYKTGAPPLGLVFGMARILERFAEETTVDLVHTFTEDSAELDSTGPKTAQSLAHQEQREDHVDNASTTADAEQTDAQLLAHRCPAGALAALLLKVEEQLFPNPREARKLLDRYLQEATTFGFSSAFAEQSRAWYLQERAAQLARVLHAFRYGAADVGAEGTDGVLGEGVGRQDDLRPTLDVVLSFCGNEDMSWLPGVLESLPDVVPRRRLMTRDSMRPGAMRLLLYHKCLGRKIVAENEHVIRQVNAILTGREAWLKAEGELVVGGDGGGEADDANGSWITPSSDAVEELNFDRDLTPTEILVGRSSNVHNYESALERNRNLDIVKVDSAVEMPMTLDEDNFSDSTDPSGHPITLRWSRLRASPQIRRFGAFYLIPVEEDVRADECSAYLAHLGRFHPGGGSSANATAALGGSFGDFTFFLHADADHHVNMDLFRQTLSTIFAHEQGGRVLFGDQDDQHGGPGAQPGSAGDSDHSHKGGRTAISQKGGVVPDSRLILPELRHSDLEVIERAERSGEVREVLRAETDHLHLSGGNGSFSSAPITNSGAPSSATAFESSDSPTTSATVPAAPAPQTKLPKNRRRIVPPPAAAPLSMIYLTRNFINFRESERLLDEGSWRQFYKEFLGSSVELDADELKYYCCAHFLVKRAALTRRSVEFYRNLLAYMTSAESFTDLLGVAVQKERSSTNKIYPVVTWYDATCRYPCQHLMTFWHVIFGEEISLSRRYEDPRMPFFLQKMSFDSKALERWSAATGGG